MWLCRLLESSSTHRTPSAWEQTEECFTPVHNFHSFFLWFDEGRFCLDDRLKWISSQHRNREDLEIYLVCTERKIAATGCKQTLVFLQPEWKEKEEKSVFWPFFQLRFDATRIFVSKIMRQRHRFSDRNNNGSTRGTKQNRKIYKFGR